MASGDVVGVVAHVIPPAASHAALTSRAGGSTPAETVLCWAFDGGSADEHLDFIGELQGYDGGGLTVTLKWMAATATSGDVVWGGAFRRVADDLEDLDGSHSYSYQETIATCASASGEVAYDSLTFTSGAQMDSLADGELFILRIRREASDTTNDDMTGDAQLISVTIQET